MNIIILRKSSRLNTTVGAQCISIDASKTNQAHVRTGDMAVGLRGHNPEAILTYKKSDIILMVHSNVSHLSESEARSRVGGISSV